MAAYVLTLPLMYIIGTHAAFASCGIRRISLKVKFYGALGEKLGSEIELPPLPGWIRSLTFEKFSPRCFPMRREICGTVRKPA